MPKKRRGIIKILIYIKDEKSNFWLYCHSNVFNCQFCKHTDIRKRNYLKKESQVVSVTNENKETVCTVTCSRVIGGVTYTAEAGNFLSTCEGASRRCEAKLDKLNTLQ